ncbi:hypothetical protein [Catenovulum sediminis]|uniref:hypothetical protein n=1 Tax=Catenovulum sediminis TaxID=1740262 RepID=UPI00163D9C06|nr:hypothetical protein [Catenovulum sediminis]
MGNFVEAFYNHDIDIQYAPTLVYGKAECHPVREDAQVEFDWLIWAVQYVLVAKLNGITRNFNRTP